jgi:hypothetical protein
MLMKRMAAVCAVVVAFGCGPLWEEFGASSSAIENGGEAAGEKAPEPTGEKEAGEPTKEPAISPEKEVAVDPAGCAAKSLGGPESCRSEQSWREKAAYVCGSGKVAEAIALATPCGEEDALFREVSFQCCPNAQAEPEPNCVRKSAVGACAEEAYWAQLASSTCAAKGATASALELASACEGGGFGQAFFSCCF